MDPVLKKEYEDKNSEIGRWLKLFFGLPWLEEDLVADGFTEIMSVGQPKS